MKRVLVSGLMSLVVASPSFAGFNSWTAETTPDPFTKGVKVEVDYSQTMRSGVFVICDSSQAGMEVRVVAGWEYVSSLSGQIVEGKFATDGKVVLSARGLPGAFGQNIAGVSFPLSAADARAFVDAMMKAKSQIAVQDGISNGPHLLKARGSTKAGVALNACLIAQASDEKSAREPDVAVSNDEDGEKTGCEKSSDQDIGLLSAGGCYARFLGYVLATEERCKDYEVLANVTMGSHLSSEDKEAADGLVEAEQKDAAAVISSLSCFGAARKVLEYTDLPYDKVWKARN